MNATTNLFIGLWLDRTSNPDEPRWIVSLDTATSDGQETTTTTLRTFDGRRAAAAFARSEAKRRGLEIVEA